MAPCRSWCEKFSLMWSDFDSRITSCVLGCSFKPMMLGSKPSSRKPAWAGWTAVMVMVTNPAAIPAHERRQASVFSLFLLANEKLSSLCLLLGYPPLRDASPFCVWLDLEGVWLVCGRITLAVTAKEDIVACTWPCWNQVRRWCDVLTSVASKKSKSILVGDLLVQ